MEIPGYRIEQEIGRGGMATVYLAVQESVERRVALKVMAPVLLVDPSFADRFTREARIAAHLYHPHVVAVHDVGVLDGQPFIAMEYLAGGDLAARMAAGRVDLASALRVVREIAGALHYAHEKGFVHRDVKPENILFREDGTAVLTDFGIARAVNSSTQMTKTGAVIGTPQYMSPEQARGKDLDGRSDLYSLGVVFYELLTGDVPFHGSDSVAVGIQHVTEPVPRLPARLQFVQPVLERFLAKHLADRYQTGAEAVADLKALEGRIITGQSPRVDTPDAELAATAVQAPARPVQEQPVPTPRPEAGARREPTLGSLEDLGAFDGPERAPRGASRSGPRPRRRGRGLAIALLLALLTVGWWQREQLLVLLPDPEVRRLLDQAKSAMEYGYHHGDTGQYANRLYQRVLELDPDNERARAGLQLVARRLTEEGAEAVRAGDLGTARERLDEARSLAPALEPVRALARSIEAASAPLPGDRSVPEPLRPAPPPSSSLLAAAREARRAGRLTGGDDSALSLYRRVLAEAPGEAEARRGLEAVRGALEDRVAAALAADRLEDAEAELAALRDAFGAGAAAALEPRLAAAREAAAAAARRDQLLRRAEAQLAADRLTRPEGDNALATYRQVLALDPGSAEAAAGIDALARRLLALAELQLEENALDEAAAQLALLRELRPALPGLDRAEGRLELYRRQSTGRQLDAAQRAELERRLAEARAALERGDLMEPPGASAYDALKAALALDPTNAATTAGLRMLSDRLLQAAGAALGAGSPTEARSLWAEARQTDPANPALPELRGRLAAAFRGQVRSALRAGDLEAAQAALVAALELEPDHEDLPELELALSIARDQDA